MTMCCGLLEKGKNVRYWKRTYGKIIWRNQRSSPGFRDNPYCLMGTADLLVCSSVFEGFSTFITEGLILGKPIVTTDVSGMRELLGDSEYGLITANDDEAFYEGVKRMLAEARVC